MYPHRIEEWIVAIFREIKGNEFCDIILASQDEKIGWKIDKFTITDKIFREIIQPFLTSLVKTLLRPIFCQIHVRVNFHDFHTVLFEKSKDLFTKILREINSMMSENFDFTQFLRKNSDNDTMWKSTVV